MDLLIRNDLQPKTLHILSDYDDKVQQWSPCLGQILNLTQQCNEDWNWYQSQITTQEWASDMSDADGTWESGFNDGNYIFEGDFKQCINAKENSSIPGTVEGLFCLATWYAENLGNEPVYTRGLGYCIPHTCTDLDARILLDKGVSSFVVYVHVLPPAWYSLKIHCVRERDLSNDAGAIVSITILSLFGAIVLASTLFDLITTKKRIDNQINAVEEHNKSNGHITTFDKTSEEIPQGHVNHGIVLNNMQRTISKDETVNKPVSHENNDTVINAEETAISMNGTANGSTPQATLSAAVDTPVHVSTVKKPSDQRTKRSIPARLFLAFSLYTNVPRLVSAKQAPGSFQCINGIRFLTMAWIMLGHTYQLGTYITSEFTVSNRWPMFDALSKYVYQLINEMWLAVETFFVMSAMLTTISFMKNIKKQGDKVTVRQMILYYFHRYWRLTPVYMIILMIWTNLYYYMGEGPFFRDYTYEVESCKDTWWQHMLYIQNLFPADESSGCMGWTWYLANDFQFYVIAPVFLILTYFFPWIGLAGMIAGYTGSLIANVVLYGKLYDGTPLPGGHFIAIYIRPWTRATSYFIGMMLGYLIMRSKEKRIKLNLVFVILGWILSLWLINLSVFGKSFIPSHPSFMSLQTTLFAVGVSWIIYACISGYGGIFNIILSWNFWVPLARLTYTGYLIHPMLIYVFMYTSPRQVYVYHRLMLYLFCGHLIFTLLASFVITLVFEIPMLGLEKVLIPTKKKEK